MLAFAKKLLNNPLSTWVVLFWPAPAMLMNFVHDNGYYAEIMYESGLLATQLLLLALAITPLMRLSRNWPPIQSILRWLQKRRRYIGVASFGYASLHTLFYIRELGSAELIWLELEEISLATGWLAIIVMAALAVTSNNWSVRKLGKGWKKLQMGAYFAVALTALHWWLIGQFLDQLWFWMVPLAMLQVPRVATTFTSIRQSNSG